MKFSRFVMSLIPAVALCLSAHASVYNEVGDAGQTVATAQSVGSNTTQINGAIHTNDGADVFSFSWGGGVFSADTYGSPFDTMLSIFDTNGNILAFNDDYPWCCASYVSTNLLAGNYLLGITYYPNNYWGNIGGYSTSSYYDASYQIHTSSINGTNVPEPSAIILFGLGLVSVGFMRARKTK